MYNSYEKITITNTKHKNRKRRRIRKILKIFTFTVILIFILIIAVKYYANIKSGRLLEISYKTGIQNFLYNNKYLKYNYKFVYSLENEDESNFDDLEIEKTEDIEDIEKTHQYDYTCKVPESEEVEDDFFSDAVFIGDSRTEGFIMYNGLSNTTSFTAKGLMVDTVFTRPVINMNGKKLTVMEALSETKFDKVYIMLGVNELGWAYSEIFIKKYSEIIDYIKEINSDAQIYIQSILPVSYEKSTSDKIYNNENINNYNELIKKMTEDKQVYYLDAAEVIMDEEGNLPSEAALDGIHLKKEYCQKWYQYLKNHTVKNKAEEEGK